MFQQWHNWVSSVPEWLWCLPFCSMAITDQSYPRWWRLSILSSIILPLFLSVRGQSPTLWSFIWSHGIFSLGVYFLYVALWFSLYLWHMSRSGDTNSKFASTWRQTSCHGFPPPLSPLLDSRDGVTCLGQPSRLVTSPDCNWSTHIGLLGEREMNVYLFLTEAQLTPPKCKDLRSSFHWVLRVVCPHVIIIPNKI